MEPVCIGKAIMSTRIIDRGRGPELQGTRITVYRIMDYVREGSEPERIAAELDLTEEQVTIALAYITAHRRAVEDEYEKILMRSRQPNPAWVEAGGSATPEELKSRILARRVKEPAKARRRGQ
jgi:uncharacterized protein (DUF433 family)